ncbi:heterokaryon incompatibility protein-domain-containing protein [Lophiotrema nucula]|uniref:Heterokaryon incompatibility protein-domain-containing protein n=1 Tax=Lophiotrema nucula TaxID=690887 RepID=A0A6A5ZB96_9PLEO|nr:heterokaryon incompatibility protein-domain-containing protein [Lophiotrema nucula]
MADFSFNAFTDPRSEIRILTIHPGGGDDPISCELRTFSLTELPNYEALSYTWGDNTSQKSIEINSKRFITFSNAYEGLLELRDPASPRAIWIDAICINQKDLEEKEHQILLMKVVYEKASRVIVWFPRSRGSEDLAVGLLYELRAQLAEETNSVQNMQQIHAPRLRSPEWIALRDFLDHPWWSRIWTLQEVVVGHEVVIQFGAHVIPWDHLTILDNSLLYGLFLKRPGESLYSKQGQPYGCGAITTIQWMRGVLAAGQMFSLLDLLPQCWWRSAINTRDCIFGLFALASDIQTLEISPNYVAPVEEVLTTAVQKLLLRYGTLELFCKAGLGYDRKLTELPSYVPDWTNIPMAQALYWHYYDGPQDLAPEERGISLHSNGQLLLKLFCLDSIANVTEPLTATGDKGTSKVLVSWFDAAEELAASGPQDPYPVKAPSGPSVSLFEAFWRTTTADSGPNRSRAPEDMFHGYLRYKYEHSRQCGLKPTCLFEDIEKYQEQYDDGMDRTRGIMTDWYNIMLMTSCARAFCITRNGMIGLVPPGALPGDMVCLLPGGAVPYVMRLKKQSESRNEVQLVGESYFHGVTALDALTEYQKEGKEPRSMFLI